MLVVGVLRMKKSLEKNDKVEYDDCSSLRLTNDFIFKYVFGREDNSPRLLALVNAVLEDAGFKKVVSLEIKNSELPKDASWLHALVLDIRATDENGNGYDIEVQLGHKENFEYRSLLYGAKLFESSFNSGEKYVELKPMICISFVDFDLFEGESEYHSCFVPTEIKRKHLMLLDGIRLHFIEMRKAKNREGTLAEIVSLLQGIKPQLEDTVSELVQKNPVYKEIYGDYLHCIEDEQARHDAISREKWLYDYHHGMKANYSKGLEQGAREKALEVAKSLLRSGLSLSEVAKHTGLTEEEVGLIPNGV